MINVMRYKGYVASVAYDGDDGIFVGRIEGIQDGVGFHSDNVKGLKEAFEDAVEDYLDACKEIGKKPDKPYSGNVPLRVTPELHALAARAAKIAGTSLNQFGERALTEAIKHTIPA